MGRPAIERRRAAEKAAAQERREIRAARAATALALYPTTSIRDIAIATDWSVTGVLMAIRRAGLPSRPVSETPGQPPRQRGGGCRQRTSVDTAATDADIHLHALRREFGVTA
jgi:hypothetical protein